VNKPLDALRQTIDKIDDQLLALITQRSKLAREVLTTKITAANGRKPAIFNPEREQNIVDRLKEKNTSPLSSEVIANIFQTIIIACRHLQEDSLNEQQ
jgi:chorismate mutase / prephenate dehydratase